MTKRSNPAQALQNIASGVKRALLGKANSAEPIAKVNKTREAARSPVERPALKKFQRNGQERARLEARLIEVATSNHATWGRPEAWRSSEEQRQTKQARTWKKEEASLGKHKKSDTMPESRSKHPLVWIDCEMTGLDLEKDTIMSLACFVTDANLNLLDEQGYEAVVHHTQEQLDCMGEWCTHQHGESGLTAAVLASTKTAEQAAAECLEYIQRYVKEPKKALLAGNTVHADKGFLRKEPWRPVIRYLHHRILDVSAIKEAMKRWSPNDVLKEVPRKKGLHEARADILESIEEARYYKDMIFQKPAQQA